MKKTLLVTVLTCFSLVNGFCADDPAENPGSAQTGIIVSRYGYWQFQPVKMAYVVIRSGTAVPKMFAIISLEGSCVFTGRPVLMRTPEKVFAPAGGGWPGEKVYALDFTLFNRSGCYYIRIPGMASSPLFNIGGPLPIPASSLPGERSFEILSGMIP